MMNIEKVRISDYISNGVIDIPAGYELVIPYWELYDGYLVRIQNEEKLKKFAEANTPPL